MSNPFYTYSGAFIPGMLARAEAEATEFQSVQAGFALLAIQGTDSGSANTYTVTTNGAPTGSYTDGQIVEFKAVNANTGACTVNVNGIGSVGLNAASGISLAAGAITANTWCRIVYNTTYSAFTLLAPTALVTTSNTISPSAPTNKVGLTAAGGVSTACVPIDATYAIDQSIAPTWTGAHTFSSTVAFNSTVTFSTGLSLTGGAAAYALTLTGSSTIGSSLGLLVNAGTNASDYCARLRNQSASTDYVRVLGEGSVIVGAATGGGQGVGTLNATGLFVNGVAVLTSSAAGANPTASVGLTAVNGSANTFLRSDGAPALSQSIAPTWTGAHTFTPSSAVVAITLNAKANTVGMTINGGTNTSNTYLMQILTGLGSGFSSGLYIQAGTTSGDTAFVVLNAAGGAIYCQIFGDGHGNLGPSATQGLQWTSTGAVTANALSGVPFQAKANGTIIFKAAATTSPTVQGYGPTAAALVDMTPDNGSWTTTLSGGFSSNPTGTVKWRRNGNMATVYVEAAILGTSNAATDISMSGLPAAITPAAARIVVGGPIENGTVAGYVGGVTINTGGTISLTMGQVSGATFSISVAGNWQASGQKGLAAGWSVTYPL